MTDIPNNEAYDICRECGGACCRTKPGIDAPTRYISSLDPAEKLREALASGLWVLDRHYGLPAVDGRPPVPAAELTLFYPRPAMREEQDGGTIFGSGSTGECALLGPTGCLLDFAERPFMCRSLQPDPRFECETPWDRRHAALAWYPYQDVVRKAVSRLGVSLPTGL